MKIFILKFPITSCIFLSLLTYGLSSLIYINYLGIGHQSFELYTYNLLEFQILSMFFSLLIELISNKESEFFNHTYIKINTYKIHFLFIACAVIFYFYPWSEDRESRMAQVAALFRAIWFIVVVVKLKGNKNDYYYLFLSLILMVIDTSRSTFASLCIIHLFRRSVVSLKMGVLLVISVLGIASMRSFTFDFKELFNSVFLYGFFGEGVNGSIGTFQLLSSDDNLNYDLLTVFFAFLQPLLTPFKIIFGSNLPFFDSSYFHSNIVRSSLNEEYYPMGGFYLVSEFIRLKYIGVLFFLLYIKFAFWLSAKIFPFKDSAVHFTLIFLMLKMSPFTYWKWIYYITILYFIVIWLPKKITKRKLEIR